LICLPAPKSRHASSLAAINFQTIGARMRVDRQSLTVCTQTEPISVFVRHQDVEAAEAVEAAIDTNALAVFLAQKTPEEGPGADKRKKEFDEQARRHASWLSCSLLDLPRQVALSRLMLLKTDNSVFSRHRPQSISAAFRGLCSAQTCS